MCGPPLGGLIFERFDPFAAEVETRKNSLDRRFVEVLFTHPLDRRRKKVPPILLEKL